MAKVLLDRINKQINDTVVVHDLSLEIHDQELTVLVGPVGCGMGTVLRMVAGMEEPSRGRIAIGDLDITAIPPHDRGVALASQPNPRLTVYQNIASGLAPQRLTRAQVDQRVREMADALEINEILGLRSREITSGQRLRVALGKAAVSRPKIILMDQPLAGVCGPLKVQLRREIGQLRQILPITVLYATHDESEAMALADRMVVMRNGRIHQVDTPQLVYDRPVDRFVAEYIGSPAMNFIPAMLTEEAGVAYLITPGGGKLGLPWGQGGPQQYYLGREVILGLRPEALADPSCIQHAGHDHRLEAKVELVEHLGAETLVDLSLGSLPVTARLHPHSRIRVGEIVTLVLDMERAHLFDKQTEKRIVFMEK